MKIKDVVCAAGSTGFYFDDQRAIKRGAGHDGMFYIGQPVTEGFSAVRMKGEAVSVMIVLEDGQIAFGDCAAVQYSGAGGRDPLFLAKDFIPIIEQYVRPMLLGREADDFRGLCAQMEAIEVNGKRLHTAIRYGVSQAILDAVAKATGRLMCEVVADEYGCTVSQTPIPIFTQSGDDRYDNADKMIIKRALSSLRVLHLLRIPRKRPCQDQGISDREQDQSGKMQKLRLHCTRSRQRAQPASTVLPD